MKVFKIAISLASIFVAMSIVQAQQAKTFNFPYGNFGIDYLTRTIEQENQKLSDETGVSFSYDYYADAYTNVSGGERKGANYTHIMIFGADVDFNKILGIKGGSFHISGAYNSGSDLSKKIGNFFSISESAVTRGWMFYEFYYSQKVDLPWGDSITVQAGRMSMSDNFASLPVFGYLGGGAMDSTAEAIFYASPFTSSTLASWGFAVNYQTSYDLTFSYGLYQAPSNINSSNWDGLDWGISNDDGYMMLFQVQWSPTFCGNLAGVYQAGGYFFDGYSMPYLNNSPFSRDDGYGFYLQGQQMVWVDKNNPSKNITLWCGAEYAPTTKISAIEWQAYAGAQFSGFIPSREQDSIFVSWTSGFFSDDYNSGKSDCETVFEVNYLWQVNSCISIQPVIQYVLRPNGVSDIDDAFVLGGQVMVSF